MTTKQTKYSYVKVIQINGSYGWEDVSEYDKQDYPLVKNDLKEYRLSNINVFVIRGKQCY